MENNGILWGVDYYPELCPEDFWEKDVKNMAEMGIKAVRMMEFAWGIIEPEPKKYDFSLFDKVIEILNKYNIKIVLGTPTATFPAWLYEKDPSILRVNISGRKCEFGIRRNACVNSPIYFEESMNIVRRIAEYYGRNSQIIGWQIDNELGHEGSDKCICENCKTKWHVWLENKYENIDNLNKIWGTNFWGIRFNKFEQIPVPIKQEAHQYNPCLLLDYYRFCSDSIVNFVDSQINILRSIVNKEQWISSNLYITPHSPVIDMERLVKNMDFAGFDNYPVWGDMDEPLPYYFNSYVLSYIRGLKNTKNFAIFEQFTGIQGHSCLGYLPSDNQVILWIHQAISRGADKIFFFNWRTVPFGQEQLCYGLLNSGLVKFPVYNKIAETIKNYSDIYNSFINNEIVSEACLVYSKDNSRILQDQYLTKGINWTPNAYSKISYDIELARHFAPFVLFNINCDVKSYESVELEKYKIISLPLFQITDPIFVDKIKKWVNNGGILILGWRTGTRDINNYSIHSELPGLFSELAGIRIDRFESLNNKKVKIKIGFIPSEGENWADIITCINAKPIAWYSDRKKFYKGSPCITENTFGKGKVYYIGTSLGPLGLFFLYRKIFKRAKIKYKFYGFGIESTKRKDNNGKEIEIIINHTPKNKFRKWSFIKPYGIKIIK